MAATPARMAALTDRHAKQRDSLILALVKALLGIWGDFGSGRSDVVVNGNAAQSARVVMVQLAQARRIERSYLQAVLREVDSPVAQLPTLVESYPRSGVTPLEVYRRPADQYGWALGQGKTPAEAQAVAVDRISAIAERDVMQAAREEVARVYGAAVNVSGYRRVIHPELSKSGTCGLCVAASGQVYRSGELMPLHDGDNCDTLPITGTDDPGLRLNDADLKSLYAAAGSTSAEDLVNTRITINEHGELGPVLVKQGDHFRTAEEAGRPAYVEPTPATIAAAKQAAADEARSLLTAAEHALTQWDADHPGADHTSPEWRDRVALFRAGKQQRDYLAALERLLKQPTT